MAFGLSAAAWGAIGTTAVAAYSANEQAQAGKKAGDRAKQAALVQEQEFNKLNGKRPDIGAMSDQNAMDAKAGPSGTLLTGPAGVDPNKLLLGRSTLLGG